MKIYIPAVAAGRFIEKQDASLNRATQYRLVLFYAILESGLLLGYLSTSGAKSDIVFLLSDPDFLSYKISRLSCLVSEI